MSRAYPEMSAGEREQHAVIRSYSGHSLWEVNLALVAWLKSDQVFKMELAPLSQPCELAQALVDLEIHLLCWQGKLGAWIPGHPEHALVYMADEKKHGLGFPTGLDALVSTALTELQQKWRGKIT